MVRLSHFSSLGSPFFMVCFACFVSESAFAVRDGTGAAAIASQTMFCAHSTAVRRRWLQSIQRAVQPVPASPAIVVMAAPVISDSITLSAASIPAVSDDELQIGHHPGLKQPSDAFVKLHGKCYRHGYLWKRGDMFKTWKLRYCYLVQNRLIYFRSHEVCHDCLQFCFPFMF
jgi:hypothetical protein